ncbi:SRPBCC domain-containing protein [Amycolatopsis sp. cmx-4-68]|uniref:SRPBCC family protein n=1 Tax=Amycolatopsis sp. cmx-4-68 TaxID=2790938 RepID=UPI00397BC38D
MRLDHEFTVPAPIGEVWQAIVDPERVAPCMPGATLTKVEGDKFSGTVKVKLGPISLLYKGNGEFLEKDDAAHKVTIKASGKDSRGSGTAAATVTLTLTEADGATHGAVATDLAITGKPAQFGRGLISEVGGKILDTFAGCLSGKLGPEKAGAGSTQAGSGQSGAAGPGSGQAGSGQSGAGQPGSAQSGAGQSGAAGPGSGQAGSAQSGSGQAGAGQAGAGQSGAGQPVAEPSSKPAPAATGSPAEPTATPEPVAKPEPAVKPAPTTPEINTEPKAASPAADRPPLRSVPAAPETEAIDLLDYAGQSVLKRVAPVVVALAAVAGLVAIIRALRK